MSPSVKFIQRTPEEVDNTRSAHRGRVSYPIIKGFLETEFQIAEVQPGDTKRKVGTLAILLRSYIGTHSLPITVISRSGRLYLMRLDIDDKGKAIPDWKEKLAKERVETVGAVEDITIAIIDKH